MSEFKRLLQEYNQATTLLGVINSAENVKRYAALYISLVPLLSKEDKQLYIKAILTVTRLED